MDVSLLRLFCVVRWRSLQRADHSSRGVPPSETEESHSGGMGPLGLSSHEKRISLFSIYSLFLSLPALCRCFDSQYVSILLGAPQKKKKKSSAKISRGKTKLRNTAVPHYNVPRMTFTFLLLLFYKLPAVNPFSARFLPLTQ